MECFMVLLNYLMQTVSLLLHAHFVKRQLNVRYRNTHFALNVDLIAVFRLDYSYRRKASFTYINTMLQLYSLQVKIQIEP